jgi:hypothetical protein
MYACMGYISLLAMQENFQVPQEPYLRLVETQEIFTVGPQQGKLASMSVATCPHTYILSYVYTQVLSKCTTC